MKKLLVALVALLIAASPAFAEEAKELNVFSWSEYIPQEVVNGFTKETGIKVVLSTYESNEAMYAKLKLLGAKGYDLVVPSGYFVEVMAQDNLLAKLDKSKIKGLGNLDPASLNQPFDRGNALTIPYMWGTVGLLVNKKAVDVSTIKSWKDLARPEFKGRVLLSDDLRDTFGVGLKACGYSINSTNPDEIKAAYEWLKALKPSVRVFDVTATKQAFISEEVVAGLAWNGDAFIAMQENPDLEFIVPEEGMLIWLDNFAIPAGAEHKENAYKFISYLMRPEVAKLCVEEFNYSTPNKAAEKILEPEYAESKVIVLDPEELAKVKCPSTWAKPANCTKGIGNSSRPETDCGRADEDCMGRGTFFRKGASPLNLPPLLQRRLSLSIPCSRGAVWAGWGLFFCGGACLGKERHIRSSAESGGWGRDGMGRSASWRSPLC